MNMTFKHEWDERMNGEPNHFYDLPDELQELIREKVVRSSLQECMKEMIWLNNMAKRGIRKEGWKLSGEYRRGYYPRCGFIHLRATWHDTDGYWQTNNLGWDAPHKTTTTSNDMKSYLEKNGFTGLKSKTKIQLIRLCLSF